MLAFLIIIAPVVTQVINPPKPKQPKQPKTKHGSEFIEENVLFKPQETRKQVKNSNKKIDEHYGNINGIVDNTTRNINGEIKAPNKESDRNVKAYRNVGCYKDAFPRSVPSLEG